MEHLMQKPFAVLLKPKQILQKDTDEEVKKNYGYGDEKKDDKKKEKDIVK